MTRGGQLALFAEPEPIGDVWARGLPCREGAAVYVHLVRGPADPERSPREARRGQSLRWKRLDDAFPAEWADAIVAHLADGVPRTFNRVMVELFDTTADVAFESHADAGLWRAVEDGRLEYTPSAPVYFRVVSTA